MKTDAQLVWAAIVRQAETDKHSYESIKRWNEQQAKVDEYASISPRALFYGAIFGVFAWIVIVLLGILWTRI